MEFLESMIEDFDDGRCRSFFCRASALLDLDELANSLKQAILESNTDNLCQEDKKRKAKILKAIIENVAGKKGVELRKVK